MTRRIRSRRVRVGSRRATRARSLRCHSGGAELGGGVAGMMWAMGRWVDQETKQGSILTGRKPYTVK